MLKMKTIRKKGSTPIAIVLLVLATLVLSVATLAVISTKKVQIQETVGIPSELEDVYVLENQIDYYVLNGGDKEKIAGIFGVKVEGDEVIVEKYGEKMIVSYRFKLPG